MRNYILLGILVLSVSFGFSQLSLAVCFENAPNEFVCNANPPNPDPDGIQQETNTNGIRVDVLRDAKIDTTIEGGGSGNDIAIFLSGGGNNTLNVTGADIVGIGRAVLGRPFVDTVTVYDSTFIGDSRTFDLASGNDVAIIERSTFIARTGGSALTPGSGDDEIILKNSIVSGAFSTLGALELGPGNDKVLIVNSTITMANDAFAVQAFGDDDEITLGGFGSTISNGINCDSDSSNGFDTLIFALEVPEQFIDELTAEIDNLPVPDGQITINGFTYRYVKCEQIVADLRAPEGLPIPTLSEWGMIAMAVLIGAAGLFAAFNKRTIRPRS